MHCIIYFTDNICEYDVLEKIIFFCNLKRTFLYVFHTCEWPHYADMFLASQRFKGRVGTPRASSLTPSFSQKTLMPGAGEEGDKHNTRAKLLSLSLYLQGISLYIFFSGNSQMAKDFFFFTFFCWASHRERSIPFPFALFSLLFLFSLFPLWKVWKLSS